MAGRLALIIAVVLAAIAAGSIVRFGIDATAGDEPTGVVVFRATSATGGEYRSVSVDSGEIDPAPLDAIDVAVACSPVDLATSDTSAHNTGICSVDTASGVRHLVAEVGVPVQHPTPSPNGDRIVFASGAAADRGLRVVPSTGGEATSLCRGFCPLFRFSDIAWSPSGERVAFVATTPGSGGHLPQIYTVTVGESDYTQLTWTRAIESDPAWSPDGERIAFASSRSGDTELWVMNSDGSEQRQLTDRPGRDLMPAWSPDGRWLTFSRHIDRSWDLAIISSDGGDASPLTRLGGTESRPIWLDPD